MPHVPEWKSGPLYKTLTAKLPAFCYPSGDLRMSDFHDAMGRSHEAVYKWLRASKITPTVAQRICDLSLDPRNVRLLREAGQPKPSIKDFTSFVFPA